MAEVYKVIWFGKETSCYGELTETSNIVVTCENENDDSVWYKGFDKFVKADLTWENVVLLLQGFYASDIIEVTAVQKALVIK
jgi:hypothetical protein